MTTSKPSTLMLLTAIASLCAMACDAPAPTPEDLRDGELMFDLDDEEIAEFHELYVGTDDLELTRERLTAPFDCSLFDDFCAQVGRDAAIEISGMQVELARDGVSVEAMNEQTLAWISAAMDDYEPDDDIEFRGTSNWSTRTKSDHRLRVRHGITTPWAGDREAWTQSKFQHRDWLGVWWQVQADDLCVDTGTNSQHRWNGAAWLLMNSANPAEVCNSNDGSIKKITTHARWDSADNSYRISVNGCGSADNNGLHFGICRSQYREWF